MDSTTQTEEIAAAFLAKRDTDHWSAEDEQQLSEWLGRSVANEVAFIRLEAMWDRTRRLRALASGNTRGVVPSPGTLNLSPFFEQKETRPPATRSDEASQTSSSSRIRRAIAAAVAVALLGGVAWSVWPAGTAYRTPIGGLASVPMTDGSKVTLNTDSEIRLAVSAEERRVELRQGEAFFEVAKDSKRPFVVSAGNKRVVAVGTKFSVRRVGGEIRVFVSEGRVRIEEDSLPLSTASVPRPASGDSTRAQPPGVSGSGSGRGPEVLVSVGGIAMTGGNGILVQEKPLSEVEEYLSWRTGYLVFRETSLADAVAEFNRYNDRKIVIRDPAIAAIRLSGKFQSTRFEAFVRLLEEGFPIHAEDHSGDIMLTSER